MTPVHPTRHSTAREPRKTPGQRVSTRQIIGVGFFAVIVLAYVLVFHFFAHRTPSAVIEIHFADRITEAHRILIDRYNALHAGSVKVVPIDFPNEDFSTDARKEVLARSLRGEDDAIDLLGVDIVWVHRFAKWCEPLGKYFSDAERKRITDLSLRTCYHNGELVAIPLDVVQSVMYYREDLLKRLPHGEEEIAALEKGITWTEFLRFKTLLAFKGPYYVYPASDYEGLICCYVDVLLSLHPQYFERVGFRFDNPEAREALQLLVDLVHRYGATPAVASNFTEVSSYEYFIRENGLFLYGWTTYGQDFKNAGIDRGKEKHLTQTKLPYMRGGKPASVLGGWNLMMSKFCTKKEAVVDFVKFLLSNDSQEVFYATSGYYPVVNAFYSDSTYRRRYPEIVQINELLKDGVHRPLQENYTKYSKIMSRYFYLAILGKISAAQALQNVQASIGSEDSQMGNE